MYLIVYSPALLCNSHNLNTYAVNRPLVSLSPEVASSVSVGTLRSHPLVDLRVNAWQRTTQRAPKCQSPARSAQLIIAIRLMQMSWERVTRLSLKCQLLLFFFFSSPAAGVVAASQSADEIDSEAKRLIDLSATVKNVVTVGDLSNSCDEAFLIVEIFDVCKCAHTGQLSTWLEWFKQFQTCWYLKVDHKWKLEKNHVFYMYTYALNKTIDC